MTSRIPKLTKRSVDAIRANGSDAVYWDGELTGFGLRVRASGRKKYVVQTRIRGRLRWFTIGPHGPVSVDEARARALEILALAKKGVDPRAGEGAAGRGAGHGGARAPVPEGICAGLLQAEHGSPSTAGS